MTTDANEHGGMAWWNALAEDQRACWLRAADSAIAAEAWAEDKRFAALSPQLRGSFRAPEA